MAKDWGTDWSMQRIDKGLKYTDHSLLPYHQIVLAKTVALLYMRRDVVNEGKPVFLDINTGAIYDADQVMDTVGTVTAMHMSKCTLVGDDRPVFDTEEEEEAYLSSQKVRA